MSTPLRVANFQDYLNLTMKEDPRTMSNCCGAGIVGNGGEGEGICTACKDHCVPMSDDPMCSDDYDVREVEDNSQEALAGYERGLTADRSWQ